MKGGPLSKRTLASYRLSAPVAARVADLPESDQEALAEMVAKVGEDGLDRIINALGPDGGRPSEFASRMPLLRQMAAEMTARHPRSRGSGGNWRKGADAVAAKLARSAEASYVYGFQSEPAMKKWLTRHWEKCGRRLLQEHRAAETAANYQSFIESLEMNDQLQKTIFGPAPQSFQTALGNPDPFAIPLRLGAGLRD